MAQLAGNNLGINYNFDLGAGGWKAPMDNNLFLSDAFLQPFILGILNDPIVAPVRGNMAIVGDTPTGDFIGHIDEVAIYNEITPGWDFLVPREGWKVYDQITNVTYLYDGSSWILDRNIRTVIEDPSTSGRTLALTDVQSWIRMSGDDVAPLTLTVPQNALVPFQIGSEVYVYQTTNSAVTVTPGAGVTLNGDSLTSSKWGLFRLIKVAVDTWDVIHVTRQGWIDGVAPVFANVAAPTTDTSTLRYKIEGKTVHWKIEMIYTGLDTADVDDVSITGLPVGMNDRFGGIQMEIQGSTGISLLATDTFHASYNQSSDSINFVDNAGTAMTYDGGQIQVNGTILISGWYEAT